MSTSYWGVDHGEEISKGGLFDTDLKPSQRRPRNRSSLYNTRQENVKHGALGGALGGATGVALGTRLGSGGMFRASRGLMAGAAAAGGAGGALAGGLSPNKNSNKPRHQKARAALDAGWEKRQAKKLKRIGE